MLKTIAVDQLRPGMHVQRLLGPWLKHPFWRTGFIADADTIARLQASVVEEVVIDVALGLDAAEGADADASDPAAPSLEPAPDDVPDDAPAPDDRTAPPASLGSEIERARRICREGRDVVAAMFREARLGKMVDADAAMPLAEAVIGSVRRNPAALISVARLKTADDYTYLHSVAVGALMATLAGRLGLDDEQVMEATLGGLLHDMGKAAIDQDILNKPGSLDDAEFTAVRAHPEHGARLLREAGLDHAAVLDITLHHHEKIDGSGYPHRLAGEQISTLARMGAICDVYDAVTSHRPYKRAWDPGDALRRMATWQGHFDPQLFKAFVRAIGIYPLGTLVRLESERLGVVVEQHPDQLLTPRVCVFYSARTRQHTLVQDVDLSAPGCQDRIVQVESPEQWGFKELDKLWMR